MTSTAPTLLTPCELRTLRLLADGLDNREIAARLVVKPQTVKNTLAAIYSKLSLKDHREAMLYYWGIYRPCLETMLDMFE
jgi:DNA-binding NarL/FixJ family response regulator